VGEVLEILNLINQDIFLIRFSVFHLLKILL